MQPERKLPITPLKQVSCFCFFYSYHWFNPGLPVDTFWKSEGADRPSSDRTDSTTTASFLHPTAACRDTTAWGHCRLTCHQQVPQDSSAVGPRTCFIIQDIPSQYHWTLYGSALPNYNRGNKRWSLEFYGFPKNAIIFFWVQVVKASWGGNEFQCRFFSSRIAGPAH